MNGRFGFVLPLPRFFFHPVTALVIAAVHLYFSVEHLSEVMAGHVEWTHLWKGLGALGGAYAFAALATRTAFGPRASTYSPVGSRR